MLWLLLVAATLIIGRTYVWSILLWGYGRAGQSEGGISGEPEARISSDPATVRPSAPPTATIPPFCSHPYRPAQATFLSSTSDRRAGGGPPVRVSAQIGRGVPT